MRTTITIDDDLLARASMLTGITNGTLLIRESLKAIIARESARRLASLGGSMPELELTPRRRPELEHESEAEADSAKSLAGKADQSKA